MNLTEGTKGWFTPHGGGNRVRAEVIKVWGPQCVNLRCEDGTLPSSVLIKQEGCAGYYFEPEQAEEPPAETFLQPKITGYRQLGTLEVELMNEGKALAELCGAYITKLRAHGDTARGPSSLKDSDLAPSPLLLDQRWISIGATDLQRGFMAVIRGIAQPTTF